MASQDPWSRWDHTIFRRAEVSPHHLLEFVSVTRPTVSLWLNGHQVPSPLIINDVLRIQDAVEAALMKGDLPVRRTQGMGVQEHRDKVKRRIEEYLAKGQE